MLFKLSFIFLFFVSRKFCQSVYESKFLLTLNQDQSFDYWRDGDISLFVFPSENSVVFYNFSTFFFMNTQPSNHSFQSFQTTNISNGDNLLYLLYEGKIQIFSYDLIQGTNEITVKLVKNLMNIDNSQQCFFSNISDLLILHLDPQQIRLFSESHSVYAQTFDVFRNRNLSLEETLAKITNGSIRLFIYMPFFIENPLVSLELSLDSLKAQLSIPIPNFSPHENPVFTTQNSSLYVYRENQTAILATNSWDKRLNFHFSAGNSLISQEDVFPMGFFLFSDHPDETNILIMNGNQILFLKASFESSYFHYLGQITLGEDFSVLKVADMPSDDRFTLILANQKYANQGFFLRLSKNPIFRNSQEFSCEICSYYNFYDCEQQNNDCSIVLSGGNKDASDTMLKIWVSVLVSIFAGIVLVLICCFLVQRFCVGGKKTKGTQPITNFDEVEDRLRKKDKKKLEELMKRYSINVDGTEMENSEKLKEMKDNKCPICMEPLPEQAITYFACKMHIVHVKCFVLYQEENRNHRYKCPFRCTEERQEEGPEHQILSS